MRTVVDSNSFDFGIFNCNRGNRGDVGDTSFGVDRLESGVSIGLYGVRGVDDGLAEDVLFLSCSIAVFNQFGTSEKPVRASSKSLPLCAELNSLDRRLSRAGLELRLVGVYGKELGICGEDGADRVGISKYPNVRRLSNEMERDIEGAGVAVDCKFGKWEGVLGDPNVGLRYRSLGWPIDTRLLQGGFIEV